MDLSQLQLNISLLRRYLKKNSIQQNKIELLKNTVDLIKEYLPITNLPFRPSQLIRVTINKKIDAIGNNRIHKITHLTYPPVEKVLKYGRCNLVNQSILYGSFTGLTSTKEIQPNVGDLVTTTTWKIKKGETLKVCPIFYLTSLKGDVHNSLSLKFKTAYQNFINKNYAYSYHSTINNFMQFLAEIFSKEVDESNHMDYFISSYISDIIYRHPLTDIDTIIYPSVQDYLNTSNMAIKPSVFNAKFYPAEIQEGILTGIYPVISFAGTGWSKKFDMDNEKIIWG